MFNDKNPIKEIEDRLKTPELPNYEKIYSYRNEKPITNNFGIIGVIIPLVFIAYIIMDILSKITQITFNKYLIISFGILSIILSVLQIKKANNKISKFGIVLSIILLLLSILNLFIKL